MLTRAAPRRLPLLTNGVVLTTSQGAPTEELWLRRARCSTMDLVAHSASGTRSVVALGLSVAILVVGCAAPLGVRPMDPREVRRQLTANVLTSDEPSMQTVWELNRLGLAEAFERDPVGTLARLHEDLGDPPDRDLLFALSELSFLHAERTGDRSYYLASAVYAFASVWLRGLEGSIIAADPRVRLAADLYNLGLTEGLKAAHGKDVLLPDGTLALPFGTLEVKLDRAGLLWGDYRLVRFQAAADLGVWGLRNRYRTSGVGAPLVASVEPVGESTSAQSRRVLPHVKVPVTAFLRIDSPHADLLQRRVHARLELYPADVTQTVRMPVGDIPLEIEWTTALAYTLSSARFTDIELLGFRGGDVTRALGLERLPDGLSMLQPHRRGRIPVVFVHGTASSPARWAEMVNELMSIRRIRESYEFWFFLYNTGNPIAYSGALLREALQAAVHDLDPEGTDLPMSKMVVIGHSQGGLLAKLTSVRSGDRFWELVSDEPFEQARLSPDVRNLLRRSLFVEPLPFVHRLVFVSTPHHGSYLATWRISSIGRWLVHMPGQIASLGPELLSLPTSEARAKRRLRRVPSSVDNMTPGNPFLETLASLPLADGVTAHSIIAVEGDGPVADGNDGVVEYKSAHIAGVESEKVVRSAHSSQGQPETILEVRRILLENLEPGH